MDVVHVNIIKVFRKELHNCKICTDFINRGSVISELWWIFSPLMLIDVPCIVWYGLSGKTENNNNNNYK